MLMLHVLCQVKFKYVQIKLLLGITCYFFMWIKGNISPRFPATVPVEFVCHPWIKQLGSEALYSISNVLYSSKEVWHTVGLC